MKFKHKLGIFIMLVQMFILASVIWLGSIYPIQNMQGVPFVWLMLLVLFTVGAGMFLSE